MRGRIVGLDVARGIAILGTLGTNIWIFSHPGGMLGYLASPTTPGAPAWQNVVEAVLQQLTNGKFLGLLTLMFGIGLAIQADSAQRAGRRWPGPYLWRAALLFLDGLLHYLLLVEFDVLMGYAVTGAVVAYVVTRSERAQRRWIVGAAAVHVVLVALVTLALRAPDPGGLFSAPRDNPYRDGSWWDLVLLRVDNGALFRFEPVFLFFLGVAMFTLGGRLYRADLFGASGARLRRRLMVVGAFALPVDLALGLSDPAWLFVTRYGTAPFVALGLLALVAHVWRDKEGGAATRALADLGRVSLSAYVLQNVIASALFYGWGLDLGGLAPAWRLPVTVAGWLLVSGLVIGAARLWLGRHSAGPLERLSLCATLRLSSANSPEPAPTCADAPGLPGRARTGHGRFGARS